MSDITRIAFIVAGVIWVFIIALLVNRFLRGGRD